MRRTLTFPLASISHAMRSPGLLLRAARTAWGTVVWPLDVIFETAVMRAPPLTALLAYSKESQPIRHNLTGRNPACRSLTAPLGSRLQGNDDLSSGFMPKAS